MKYLLIILLNLALLSSASAQLKISALAAASSVSDSDTTVLVQGGVTKKVTFDKIRTLSTAQILAALSGGTGTLNLALYTLTLPSDVTRLGSSIDFATEVSGKPTTLSGYGITDAQPHDTDLDAFAALTPSNDDIIQRKAGAWVNRSISQLTSDLTDVPKLSVENTFLANQNIKAASGQTTLAIFGNDGQDATLWIYSNSGNTLADGWFFNSSAMSHSLTIGHSSNLFTFTGAGGITATGAISGSNLSGSNTGDQSATTVSNTPAGNIAATTVQGAINELDSEKAGVALANVFTANQSLKPVSGGGTFTVTGNEGQNAAVILSADDGDDAADTWTLRSLATGNSFVIFNNVATFSLDNLGGLTLTGNIDTKPLSGDGSMSITGNEGSDASLLFRSDDGDDTTDSWTMKANASGNSLTLLNGNGNGISVDTAGNLSSTNLAGATRAVIYVSKGTSATDSRSGLSKYDSTRPFSTPAAAVSAAASGDTIVVEPGTYTVTTSLAKDGVSWEGTMLTSIGCTTAGISLFDDGGSAMTFYVTNFGSLESTGSGGSIAKATNASTNISFHQIAYALGDIGFWSNGGSIVGDVTGVIANTGVAVLTDNGGYTDLNLHSAVTYGSGAAVSCVDGTQYVNSFQASSDGGFGVSCGASGYQVFVGAVVHGDDTGAVNSGGTQYVTCELLDGNNSSAGNSGGESYITTQKARGPLSTLSGTGTIKFSAQELEGQIVGGSNAGSTLDVTCPDQSSPASSAVEVDAGKVLLTGTFKATGASGVAVNLTGTSSKLILRNAVLVSDAAASYSISKTTGSPTIKVYQAVGNKAVQSGITQQVGTLVPDSNVE